jgi:hypothetical protein
VRWDAATKNEKRQHAPPRPTLTSALLFATPPSTPFNLLPSTSGVVFTFEIVNEPGTGFINMEQDIFQFLNATVPDVLATFERAKLDLNITVNFIGMNEIGAGAWLREQPYASKLLVDFHNYYNWSGKKTMDELLKMVCSASSAIGPWSQYYCGLFVVEHQWWSLRRMDPMAFSADSYA